jgi:hypothetical protein
MILVRYGGPWVFAKVTQHTGPNAFWCTYSDPPMSGFFEVSDRGKLWKGVKDK